MIFDSHVHVEEVHDSAKMLLNEYERAHIGALINAASASEFDRIQEFLKHRHCYISFGIHPWSANRLMSETGAKTAAEQVERFREYYRRAHAIGEIGMDAIWCTDDLRVQRDVMIAQLNMAQELSKPVVLHVKGQEMEIAQLTKAYTLKKLVHWYSCQDYLEAYLEQDCYFTVGPDYERSFAVRTLTELVPLNRLLVETDGLSAARWAKKRIVSERQMPKILKETMKFIADIKQKSCEEVEFVLEDNFYRFLSLNLRNIE
jgi:TatD DNase family protein